MGLHGAAAIAGFTNGLPIIIKVLIIVTVCISLWINLKQFVFKLDKVTVKFTEASGWQLGSDTGGYLDMQLQGTTVSTPFFVALHLKQQKGPIKVILIVKDSVTAEEFRQLRVALRIAGSE